MSIDSADRIPIHDFEYHWRICDPRWDQLAPEQLEHIWPLSDVASERIIEGMSRRFRDRGPSRVKTGDYHAVEGIALRDFSVDPRACFSRLPIQPEQDVFVCWKRAYPGSVAVVRWRTFVEVWDSLWYPFDQMDVFDDTLAWALLVGPEEYAVYVEAGPSDQTQIQLTAGLLRVPDTRGDNASSSR